MGYGRNTSRYDSAAPLQSAILASSYDYKGYDGQDYSDEIEGWQTFHYEECTELDLEDFGHLEVIELEGGGEGSGEHMHIVFKLTGLDGEVTYYKVDGYYASYDGSDWSGSDLYQVTPREKTITVYE